MKLLVFAHTPPPHHGQSYMVQLMLEGFGGDCRRGRHQPKPDSFGIQCYHVNARLSKRLEEIGDFRVSKLLLLLWYCLQAIWCRFRYGVRTLYYIPAPGKASALYRDWLVMCICRPFFTRTILHWHAAGLGKWLETSVQMRWRSITYRFLKQVDLSLVLSKYNQADAEKLFSRQIRVVNNGIPDPCPGFAREVLPLRRARFVCRQKLLSSEPPSVQELAEAGGDPQLCRVLYLAHCTREKGVFDTLAGVELANRQLAQCQSPLSLRLLVAGTFVSAHEKAEFERLLARPETAATVRYFGFVGGEQKAQLFTQADLFCFPTYYQNENQPVNLIEATAFGLPILTTRWRSIPELFPSHYPGLVDIRSPEQIAEALLALATVENGEGFRNIFLGRFTMERHLTELAAAFVECEQAPVGGAFDPGSHFSETPAPQTR